MQEPTLSVCMSNYNHARFLRRSIEGVVSQSRPPDEFIIIDDGSSDDSVRIIESYARRYDFIHFLRHEKNQGAIRTHNEAFELAAGSWYYGAAADDRVLPGALEAAMDLAGRHPEVGIVFGPMLVTDENGQKRACIASRRWKDTRFASPESFLREYMEVERAEHSQGASTFYRKRALHEVGGFRPELGHWTDTFALRAIGLRHGAGHLAEPVAAWTVLPDSTYGATRGDPRQMLDIIARAAWLMRSDEFADVFPASHVVRWEREARKTVLSRYWKATRKASEEQLTAGQGRTRWLARLRARRIADAALREMKRYAGDVSCYASPD